jgi:hypothetical protein
MSNTIRIYVVFLCEIWGFHGGEDDDYVLDFGAVYIRR